MLAARIGGTTPPGQVPVAVVHYNNSARLHQRNGRQSATVPCQPIHQDEFKAIGGNLLSNGNVIGLLRAQAVIRVLKISLLKLRVDFPVPILIMLNAHKPTNYLREPKSAATRAPLQAPVVRLEPGLQEAHHRLSKPGRLRMRSFMNYDPEPIHKVAGRPVAKSSQHSPKR